MSDPVALALVAALTFDALANLARIVAIEIAYRRQAAMMRAHELEIERRIESATGVVSEVAEAVAERMAKP